MVTNALRPPLHALIAVDNLLQQLLIDLGFLILEPDQLLQPRSVHAQIGILEQLRLHKGRQGPGLRYPGVLKQASPGAEQLVVDVLHHVVQMDLGKVGDDGALEARLDAEHVADQVRHGPLRRVALVDHVEGRRWAHLGRVPLCLAGRVPFGDLPERARHVVDVHRVGAEVLGPEPLHLGSEGLVDARHAKGGSYPLGCVRAVHVGETDDNEVESG